MFQIMFYAGLVFTIVFLILTVFFFVKHDVAKQVGDVTGRNAKKAIRKRKSDKKIERENKVVSLEWKDEKEEVPDGDDEETEVLYFGDEVTEVLEEMQTTVLAGEETSLLCGENVTTLLKCPAKDEKVPFFELLVDVTVVHTEQSIFE